MTRPYKDFTPRMGVYRVTHQPSGRTLLGYSTHVQGLLNRFRFQLEHGSHPHKNMQRDWQTDGAAAFTFEVLDELTTLHPGEEPVNDLKELLQLWQEKLNLSPQHHY